MAIQELENISANTDQAPGPVTTPTFGEMRTERQKLYDARVMERVKAGIALLEREHGPDWVEKIDLGILSLASGSHCVLGQIYGSYEEGERILFDCNSFEASKHGFYSFVNPYGPLQAAWEDALTPTVTEGEGS